MPTRATVTPSVVSPPSWVRTHSCSELYRRSSGITVGGLSAGGTTSGAIARVSGCRPRSPSGASVERFAGLPQGVDGHAVGLRDLHRAARPTDGVQHPAG